jgi:hypothetical protein
MAVKTLDHRSAILTLLFQVSYTLSRLRAHPLGAPYIPAFEALRAEGLAVLTREIALNEAVIDAQARVDVADDGLDDFAGRGSKAILAVTHDDRSHTLYRHFFGTKPLAELRRPVLAGQLTTMKAWPSALQECGVPALQAMAPELVPLLEAAEAAEKARFDARQAMRKFRDMGERRQWIDRLNATRKEAHGALAKLPHQHTGLPSDFASQFFLSSPEREAAEPAEGELPETPEVLREHIATQRKAIEAAETRLAELEAAEAAVKQAAEARAAEEAQLAELDRAAAELEQKRAALREKLAAKPA